MPWKRVWCFWQSHTLRWNRVSYRRKSHTYTLWKRVWYCWQSHTHMRWKPCIIPLQIAHVIRERTVCTMFFHRTHYFLSNRVYNDLFPPCLIFIFSLIYYSNLKFQILNYEVWNSNISQPSYISCLQWFNNHSINQNHSTICSVITKLGSRLTMLNRNI